MCGEDQSDEGKEQDIREESNRLDDPPRQLRRPWCMPNPDAKGSIWVISNVRTIPMVSTRKSLSGATRDDSTLSSAGESSADDPARITIIPMADGTLPLAMAVIGGPTGAPGQTARTKNPSETMGSAWNTYSKPRVTAGTSR